MEELTGDIEDCLEDGLITEEESSNLLKLCKSAEFMSSRYLHALYKIQNEGTWKTPYKKER